jgi:hypothetical protein
MGYNFLCSMESLLILRSPAILCCWFPGNRVLLELGSLDVLCKDLVVDLSFRRTPSVDPTQGSR